MKSLTYRLSIKNPCQKKDWANMEDAEKGKFCSVCARHVFDFASWTDDEIIHFINHTDQAVCARMSHEQMNRALSVHPQQDTKRWHKIAAAGLLLLTTTTLLYAKEKPAEGMAQYQLQDHFGTEGATFPKQDSIKNKIKGKLVEERSGRPIAGMNIVLKGTRVSAETDSLGNFSIIVPDNFPGNEIVLVVDGAYGFEGQTQKTVYKKELPITGLVIKKPDVMVGEIEIIPATPKKSRPSRKH
ncbi:carboxypeptidase-like regulatory domain-containing protein [Chitinophaga qingshengii]|uniref:Carboxypeptidase-like regulatory domain-containing protein n=1 Tax=Chitinophaga qingshengii TaxID=1569794 RepID=A0ABR7TKC3_9BACT|nr:carboxypeptidase-like regulatory domain-containing protein [Chitinophaga qingshengii]MBC9929981.1 carboxypeptidase-like regulatory domain-containing protein [Chitinophaga qingshengii]